MDNEVKRQGTVTGEQNTGGQEAGQHDRSQEETKAGKTFTEEEVNDIVRKRLAREREKLNKAFQEGTRESELDERERKILKRELRADTLEKLAENNLPPSLADLVNYDSAEDCEKSLTTVTKAFNAAVNQAVKGKARQSTPRDGGGPYYGRPDPIAGAFGIKR